MGFVVAALGLLLLLGGTGTILAVQAVNFLETGIWIWQPASYFLIAANIDISGVVDGLTSDQWIGLHQIAFWSIFTAWAGGWPAVSGTVLCMIGTAMMNADLRR